MDETQLTRREIRDVFRRNRGEAYRLAANLKISRTTVSLWMRGKITSQNVAVAARARAIELLAGSKESAA